MISMEDLIECDQCGKLVKPNDLEYKHKCFRNTAEATIEDLPEPKRGRASIIIEAGDDDKAAQLLNRIIGVLT